MLRSARTLMTNAVKIMENAQKVIAVQLKGEEYCLSPDCQLNYGSGCDGNQKPDGVDTSDIPRTKVGDVPYGGVGIYDCENSGDIAITFDDGPYEYTDDLLDLLAEYEAKATFFITGTNLHKGKLNDPELPAWRRKATKLRAIPGRTADENFTQMSDEQARNQMIYNEIALNDILGYIPTYMRPPYSICEDACQSMLEELGYHVVYFDLDTEGYLHSDPGLIQDSKDIWDAAVEGTDPCTTSYLEIEHDIHYQVVYNLTEYLVESLFRNGYRSVTVGQCLGDPAENWYRAGSGDVPAYTFVPKDPTATCEPGGLPISVEGDCGDGVATCEGSEFGSCCSQYGWCGATTAYCGEGCQPGFGSGCDEDE
ncbi:putative chitin deacetylase protein [Eutypa lata UCREL1]|uniref:Putative chitin deacetylase protein n=1 Tax=Eutypa lata (strain UCR-EL1) TaxID=1287681 RepID=M7T783_EUTLA|nr:putative chitin deacetylase protein [Eutypa lata UCREL1]